MHSTTVETVKAAQLAEGNTIILDDPGCLLETERRRVVASVRTYGRCTIFGVENHRGLYAVGSGREMQRLVNS